MKNRIQIICERQNNNANNPWTKVFSQILELDESIEIPYYSIYRSFRFLYGYEIKISICIQQFKSVH